MTRTELQKIGEQLNLNCGGEGSGVPGPCPMGGNEKTGDLEPYRQHKGTNAAANKRAVSDSKIKVNVPEAIRVDVERALAHLIESKPLMDQMKGVTVETVSGDGSKSRIHGTMRGNKLIINPDSLKQHGAGFLAGVLRHELEHKILTDKGVSSGQQESRVRYTAGMWAAMKYANMAKTNPADAAGFKKAAIEQGIKVN